EPADIRSKAAYRRQQRLPLLVRRRAGSDQALLQLHDQPDQHTVLVARRRAGHAGIASVTVRSFARPAAGSGPKRQPDPGDRSLLLRRHAEPQTGRGLYDAVSRPAEW